MMKLMYANGHCVEMLYNYLVLIIVQWLDNYKYHGLSSNERSKVCNN